MLLFKIEILVMNMNYNWTNDGKTYQLIVGKQGAVTPDDFDVYFQVMNLSEPRISNGTRFDVLRADNMCERDPIIFSLMFSNGKFKYGRAERKNLPTIDITKIDLLKEEIRIYLKKIVGDDASIFEKYIIDSDLPENYKKDLKELIK